MKTKQQLLDEIATLKAQYDAMPEMDIIYKPKMRERYWWIDGNGGVREEYWAADSIDNARLARGNCYPTREAAERIDRNRMTLIKLREFAFEPDWNDEKQEKYCFNIGLHGLNGAVSMRNNYGSPVHFATGQLKTQALEAVGKEAYVDMLKGGLV